MAIFLYEFKFIKSKLYVRVVKLGKRIYTVAVGIKVISLSEGYCPLKCWVDITCSCIFEKYKSDIYLMGILFSNQF